MSVTPDQFRDALRHFPAGVTVVTLRSGDEVHGLTVSAFASVSPEPPLIVVVIDHRHRAFDLLDRPGAVFAVNFLGEEQSDFSERFAWSPEDQRFAAGSWEVGVTGAPVLAEAVAWIDCTIHSRHRAGTHTLFVGEVHASRVTRPDARPLVYWDRAYHGVRDAAPAKPDEGAGS